MAWWRFSPNYSLGTDIWMLMEIGFFMKITLIANCHPFMSIQIKDINSRSPASFLNTDFIPLWVSLLIKSYIGNTLLRAVETFKYAEFPCIYLYSSIPISGLSSMATDKQQGVLNLNTSSWSSIRTLRAHSITSTPFSNGDSSFSLLRRIIASELYPGSKTGIWLMLISADWSLNGFGNILTIKP